MYIIYIYTCLYTDSSRTQHSISSPFRISKRRVKRERRMVRFLQYLASGRSWAIVDRQPAVTAPRESSSTEAHIVATLPYARHAFLPSAPNIPKSATATWGHLNKNLMWKVTNSPQLKRKERKKKRLARSLARSCRVVSFELSFFSHYVLYAIVSLIDCMVCHDFFIFCFFHSLHSFSLTFFSSPYRSLVSFNRFSVYILLMTST